MPLEGHCQRESLQPEQPARFDVPEPQFATPPMWSRLFPATAGLCGPASNESLALASGAASNLLKSHTPSPLQRELPRRFLPVCRIRTTPMPYADRSA